ncbi:hypothetical protein F6V25_08935 [Oryzomonas japonica]|uniref:Uncharacterized protein n=1 Tax=Oryzomonas japonica TaxID=2603858 RepID=A0A7J4ZS72_9BACT|nr:hypothetical protein [Oryzomonas japonica]KAB0665825.1 hypothetical protein F6V25_08935 [Oryzomonas japonica]
MAETIKLKISPPVAACLRPGQSAGERLQGIGNAPALEPFDRFMLIFCLMKDGDAAVKAAAQAAFSSLPGETLLVVAGSSEAHPALLDAIAKVHHQREGIAEALLGNEQLSAPARSFLERIILQRAGAAPPADSPPHESKPGEAAETAPQEPDVPVDETAEEFQSKYQMAQVLGIAEKIKMALTGDKEWRSILVKDANKLVSGSVVKNPRMTEGEVVTLLKSGIQNDEIMRLICANKDWVKVYNIRKALVDNHRTPIQNALRYLSTLSDKDIAGYAKSKNVSSVISTQAKRLLLNKKR